MLMNLTKSLLHNIVVLVVGFIVAFIGTSIDTLLGIHKFSSSLAAIAGVVFLAIGFLLRVWAAYYFYKNKMNVIVLKPQTMLITSGPYRFSRNPLYLGGNVFIFLGACLALGTLAGLTITIVHLPLMNLMIRREEEQLKNHFGKKWIKYKKDVRRWL